MPGEDQPRAPFNEQAALAELERLQRALEASRQRRKQASAAFDDFVGSFRKGPAEPASGLPVRSEPHRYTPVVDVPVGIETPPAVRRRVGPAVGMLAGTVLVVTAGMLLTRAWRGSQAPANTGSAVPPSTARQPSTSAASGSTAPGQPAADTVPAELIALRDVWVRATVDGERAVERELAAGVRVPLRAARTIVIRAGDAGAVRISIGGQDRGTLGPDGEVLTRTFAVSPAASR